MNSTKKLMNSFLREWYSYFSFKSLTPKAQSKLRSMCKEQKYSKLSSRSLAKNLHIGRRSFDSLKAQQAKSTKKVGRPTKISLSQERSIINKAIEKRKKSKFVTMKWATKYAHDIGANVNRTTVTRLFKKYKWRRISTRRRQGYCLTRRYHKIIENWKYYTRKIILSLDPFSTVHVMDETGIATNMLPAFSYAPKDEHEADIKTVSDTTKDTLILTISSNGNAHSFYVPFLKKTRKRKGRAGVGLIEMHAWVDSFLKYAKAGDLLIMDNLAAHCNEEIVSRLKKHGIKILFIPVRSAMYLSPLDNCFFAILKYRLANLLPDLADLPNLQLKKEKYQTIIKVVDDMIKEKKGIRYFIHCSYDKMGLGNILNDSDEHDSLVIHDRLNFDFEGEEEEKKYIVVKNKKQDNETSNKMFVSNSYNSKCITTITAFLFINHIYRNMIKGASYMHPIIKDLNNILESEKTNIYVDAFYKKIAELLTLEQIINYINDSIQNRIQFF